MDRRHFKRLHQHLIELTLEDFLSLSRRESLLQLLDCCFEPNVSATWGRFTSQVVPLLDGIKTGFGLDDFRVVLDKTTTTDDLVDRNTMYAKIYVGTKAVEFIAIDFVITNAGASFDD